MNFVERDNGEWIAEGLFRFRKWYTVFGEIGGFLPGVPGKTSSKDGSSEYLKSNIGIKISVIETG